jgi:hypothetical protein
LFPKSNPSNEQFELRHAGKTCSAKFFLRPEIPIVHWRKPHDPLLRRNAGSLFALLAYPVFIEPRLGLIAQGRAWFTGYVALVCAIAIAAAIVWKTTGPASRVDIETETRAAPTAATRAFWLAAAFVPSALMLAVTNHISANLIAAPFLWVIPVAVYLLTFMLAFARGCSVTVDRVSAFVPIIFLLSPYVGGYRACASQHGF